MTDRVTSCWLAVVCVVSSAGCSDRDDRAATVPPRGQSFEDAFAIVEELVLEENEHALTVDPRVRIDPLGGFLIADKDEAQIRKYSGRGDLLHTFGAKGDGPGEFRGPTVAIRLPSGNILAVDRDTRAAIFDSAGQELVRTIRTPFVRVEDVDVVNDSLVLFAGYLTATSESERLHLWNLKSDSIVTSYFAPRIDERNLTAATIAGWSFASVRGDTVAAVFALSDTVYLYTTAGRELSRVPIASDRFVPVNGIPSDFRPSPKSLNEWFSTFHVVSWIEWLSDGRFVLQYMTAVDNDFRWSTLVMTRDGRRVVEVTDTPRMLAATRKDESLYFLSPTALTANKWVVVRLRQ